MFPGFDLVIEGISWTRSVHHLPVPLQGEVGLQTPTTDCTRSQVVSNKTHGMLRWQTARVVTNEGDAIAYRVVSEGVGSLPEPASPLVDVPIRACDKALGAPGVLNYWNISLKSARDVNPSDFTCILCHPSPCPPGGSAAWSACLQSTAGRSDRAGLV